MNDNGGDEGTNGTRAFHRLEEGDENGNTAVAAAPPPNRRHSCYGQERPSPKRAESGTIQGVAVTLLTGGDRPCAFGLATELISKGVSLDLIGSDDLDCMAVGCGDALLEKRRTLRRRTIFPKGRPHQETRASSRFP